MQKVAHDFSKWSLPMNSAYLSSRKPGCERLLRSEKAEPSKSASGLRFVSDTQRAREEGELSGVRLSYPT